MMDPEAKKQEHVAALLEEKRTHPERSDEIDAELARAKSDTTS